MILSDQPISINDEFSPTPIDGIDVVEVISKRAARRYVLVHPVSKAIRSLDIKEHFVYHLLDGQTSLAQVKQQYYEKFKVLPTQHLLDLVRDWFDHGFFVESTAEVKDARVSPRGWWGVKMPSTVLRATLGSIVSLLTQPLLAFVMLILAVSGLVWCGVAKGALFLHRPFDLMETPEMLMGLFLGIYGSHAVASCFRLGALAKGHKYLGDRMILGGFWFLPSVFIGDMGLSLKPKELVITARGLDMIVPLLLCSLCSVASIFGPASMEGLLLSVALGASLHFLMGACPFIEGSLAKFIESLGDGYRLKELRAAFREDVDVFVEEYGASSRRLMDIFAGAIFVWVVIGSSFLLFTFARLAEVLGAWGAEALSMGQRSSQFWQLLLYIPILLGFFWMLWKLVQPFVERWMQLPMWREERLLHPILAAAIMALWPLYDILPSLFIRSAVGLLLFVSLIYSWMVPLHKSLVGWKWIFLFLFLVTLGCDFMPERAELLTWCQTLLWGGWSLWTLKALNLYSTRWLLRSVGVFVVGVSFCIYSFGFSLDPKLAIAIIFSLWLAFAAWTCLGQLGVQTISGALGSLFLLLSFAHVGHEKYESFALIALILCANTFIGLSRSYKKLLKKIPHMLQVHSGQFEKGIKKTLSSFLNEALGPFIGRDTELHYGSLPRMSVAIGNWTQACLSREVWDLVGRVAINGAQWPDRGTLEDDACFEVLSRYENDQSITMEQRVKLLHSQLCFKGFTRQDIEELADWVEIHVEEDEEELISQGEDGHPFLEIIIKGNVVLERTKPGGAISTLAELGPKDALKADDLFRDDSYDFSARCRGRVITMRLYREHLISWAEKDAQRMPRVLESVNLANMIMKLSLFRDFSASQVRLLMEKLKKLSIPKGKDVITQGDDGDEFYLLDEGQVAILVHQNEVARLNDGSYFGEIALLQKCKRTATVRTTEDSVLYSLEQKDFDRFFASGRGAQVLQNVSSSRTVEDEA